MKLGARYGSAGWYAPPGVDLSNSCPANFGSRDATAIPYGNKDVAIKLGARYGSAGWYAPPGVDLPAFGERGWL